VAAFCPLRPRADAESKPVVPAPRAKRLPGVSCAKRRDRLKRGGLRGSPSSSGRSRSRSIVSVVCAGAATGAATSAAITTAARPPENRCFEIKASHPRSRPRLHGPGWLPSVGPWAGIRLAEIEYLWLIAGDRASPRVAKPLLSDDPPPPRARPASCPSPLPPG